MAVLPAILLGLVTVATAWFPGEHKQIFSRDGRDLFDLTSQNQANSIEKRFLPSDYSNSKGKIRGVNLGSLFVLENWLADDVMMGWGCNAQSEFDCVSSLNNQDLANQDFQGHWSSWVDADDFATMVSYGLNTVRIPVGYWIMKSLVDPSEHFPQGGEQYLDQVVGLAKDAGIYVIIDLHGAPGAQVTDADTGQYNPSPGFYSDYNYNRSYVFMEWMTEKIHTNPSYSTVGMLMLVNEPERTFDTSSYPNALANTQTMRETYYPTAWSGIRDKESSLGVADNDRIHIQMMDNKWSSGDPNEYLTDLTFAAYDDHEYVKYASNLATTQEAYMNYSCNDDRTGNFPVIVGEWSLSVNSDVEWSDSWNPNMNVDWYKQWWAAQVMAYEKVQGWIFWTWKTTGTLNDPRWDYQRGVALGIISTNPDDAYSMGVCGTGTGTSSVSALSVANRSKENTAYRMAFQTPALAYICFALLVMFAYSLR